MGVDRNLLSEFAKITNDTQTNTQTQLYGTVVTQGDKKYVKMDGSDIITPIISTTDIKDGERVMVSINNHIATVTGNITNPSAGNDRVSYTEGKVDEFDYLFAGNITAGNIAANSITSDKILAGSITTDKLMAESIIADKIAADAIESKHIKADAIESKHIKAGSIEAEHIKAGIIESDHISSGTITADKIATGTITAGSGIIAEGAIGSAQISSLDVAKLESGTIDTSKIYIAGADGHLQLKGNRLQVFDGLGNSAVERVSLGDVNGDGSKFGLRVRGADGETILLDENGVTSEGITDGSITNNKISDDANIDGAKLNINSVVTEINDNGTEVIKGTKISVNGTNLETKLSTIETKQTTQGNTISQHSSKISANEKAISLKVDNQTYTTDKQNMTTQLNKNTSSIEALKGEISLKVEQTDIENAKSEIEGVIDTKVNSAKSEIKITTDAIKQNVSNLTQTVSTKADGSTVSTLSNKVGSLETSVNGISGKVTSLEKTTTTLGTQVNTANTNASSALNKANSATTTANNAQNTANTNKSNITNLQGEVSTVKSNVASLEVTTSGISQKVSSVESTTATLSGKVNTANNNATNALNTANSTNTKLNNLQIGGRNLIRKANVIQNNSTATFNESTKTWTIKASAGAGGAWGCGLVLSSKNILVPYGKSYVLSFEIKVPRNCRWNVDINNYALTGSSWGGNDNDNVSKRTSSGTNLTANQWIKCWVKWENTNTNNTTKVDLYDNSNFGVVMQNETSDMTYEIRNIQGELGNMPTEYTPAPEDVDGAINSVDSKVGTLRAEYNSTKSKVATIETNLNGITQRVSSTESTTATLTTKVNNANSNATNALNKANSANTLADSKAKVFTSTPTVPYKVGDLWVQGTNGDVMKCKTARASGSYTASDWEKASKYTDDTKANAVDGKVTSLQGTVNTTNSKVATLETNLNGITSRVTNTENNIKTTNNNVTNLTNRVATAESKITESAITNTVKKNFYTKSETNSQITSKGYQTASQVQQTVNGLQVKVSQSGGYNLIKNSTGASQNTRGWTCTSGATLGVGYNDGIGSNNRYFMYLDNGTTTTERFAFSSRFKLKPNTKYTFVGYFHNYTTCPSFDVFVLSSTSLVDTDTSTAYTNIHHLINSQNTNGSWKKFTATFTTHANIRSGYIRIDNNGYNSAGTNPNRIHWNALLLVEGELELPWSPHPSEVYDGITTIDKDGITVKQSNISTYTTMDASSFRVENNTGGTVAEFSKNSQIPNLTAGIINANEIYANNIVRKSTHVKNYYVAGGQGNDVSGAGGNWSNACKTVQYVLDNYVEDVLDYDVNIYVGQSVPGWTCKSKSGKGVISFLIQDDCIVRDPLYLDNCTNRIAVHGTDAKKGTFMTGIVVTGCHNFDIGWVSFRGKNWAHNSGSCNVFVRSGSKGIVRFNDFNGCTFAIIVDNNSEIWLYQNRGSDITHYIGIGAYTTIYGMRSGTDVCPDFTGYYYGDAGHANLYHIHDGANYTKTPSIGWSPSYTPSQKTQTWSFNNIWSDETLKGWSDRQELIQGYSSTWNTGRWTGYMQFTDDMAAIRNTISGGTNLSGRIYVQRTSSSGNSTGSKLCLYGSDGTLITNSTSINRGQGVWVSLSSSIIQKIQSGAIKYFYLKADADNKSTYFKCERNCKIEITYTK